MCSFSGRKYDPFLISADILGTVSKVEIFFVTYSYKNRAKYKSCNGESTEILFL